MRKSLLISGLAAMLLSPVASQAEPTQAAASLPPPGPFSTPQVADSNILHPTARVNRQQLVEKMKRRWDERKAEHEKNWQTYKEEQELRRQEMQQRREQRANAHYRPFRSTVVPQNQAPSNSAPTTAAIMASQPAPAVQYQMPPGMPYGMPRQRPSYGYSVPQTYGYGTYPTQPNNFGAPRGYPQRPPQANWRRW